MRFLSIPLNNSQNAATRRAESGFDPTTPVATPDGTKPIGDIQVGDTVMAYDPTTGQAKAEPVEHVFINHDTNLLDVTLAPFTTTTTPATQDDAISPKEAHAALVSHGTRAPPTSQPETLHTTTEHPFLTTDRGFVDAVKLQVGEQVQQLDGRVGVVVAVVVTPGAAVRYNLTVRELHTFAVGSGKWVVHNCNDPIIKSIQDKIDQRRLSNPKHGGDFGGLVVRKSDGTVLKSVELTGRNPLSMHAEQQGLRWADNIAQQTGEGNLIVDILTERAPCGGCTPNLTTAINDASKTVRVWTRDYVDGGPINEWRKWGG